MHLWFGWEEQLVPMFTTLSHVTKSQDSGKSYEPWTIVPLSKVCCVVNLSSKEPKLPGNSTSHSALGWTLVTIHWTSWSYTSLQNTHHKQRGHIKGWRQHLNSWCATRKKLMCFWQHQLPFHITEFSFHPGHPMLFSEKAFVSSSNTNPKIYLQRVVMVWGHSNLLPVPLEAGQEKE